MNKEKLTSLIKYKQTIENSLSSPVPPKHVNHPNSYKQFLEKELKDVNTKIETIKNS